MNFTAPHIDYAAVAPMLVIFAVAILAVLVEAFAPRAYRASMQLVLALFGIVGALALLIWHAVTNGTAVVTAGRSVAIDGPAMFLQGTILVLALLAVLTMADRGEGGATAFTPQASAIPGSPEEALARRAGLATTEIFPLALFCIGGMLLFPAANDLLTMFVALEVLSLPLYLMCGLARRRRLLSQEAALKYFLLGSFSSAFFLFGSAMLFGFAGSINFADISKAISGTPASSGTAADPGVLGMDAILLLGAILVAVGLLFKVGAAPFHSWMPDVYQGAPTPITGFMAACTKVAAFGALLRVAYVALPAISWDWQPVLFVIAILTMLVGSIVAIVQADVKRMLAYSSIAHAGFLLVGVMAMDTTGVSGVMFYLLAYGFTTIGAFALITLVRTKDADGGIAGEATHLSAWAGLGRRSPLLAGLFTLFLLALAGIPLTSGFIGKYAVFSAAINKVNVVLPGAGVWLVIVGVLASAIAAFFYVRVIVLMYFSEPTSDTTTVTTAGPMTALAVAIGAVATLVLGIYPSIVLDLAQRSSLFIQ